MEHILAKKRFGQHFLIDEEIIHRILAFLALRPADSVLEIGPGYGALTAALIASHSDVEALEIDRDLVARLQSQFPDADIVQGDALKVAAEQFLGKRVVGNLPYNISTTLILRLLSLSNFVDLHFMLQREVVDRLTAKPFSKAWGRLSVKVQYAHSAERLFDVPPQAFVPVPKVHSSFVRITYHEPQTKVRREHIFDQILTAAFNQRRKKLQNSLKAFDLDWREIDVDPSLRADQTNVSQYVCIANSLNF